MNRDEYVEFLLRFPIESPVVEDLCTVLSHFGEDTFGFASRLLDGTFWELAIPLAFVRGSVRTVSLYPGSHRGGKEYHPKLVTRVFGPSYSGVSGVLVGQDLAYEYAEQNWGDELIDPTWVEHVVFNLYRQDNHKSGAVPDVTAFVALSCRWNTILNDHSQPHSVLVDKAIVHATLSPVFGAEMVACGAGYVRSNCLRCGGGFELGRAHTCEKLLSSSSYTALPPKVAALLSGNGYRVLKGIEKLWSMEAERHAQLLRDVAAYRLSR